MDEQTLTFLPVPSVVRGVRRDGLTRKWPTRCIQCRDKQCEEANASSGLQTCSYGYNYEWLDESLLIAGFVVRDTGVPTKARIKAARHVGLDAVTTQELEAIENSLRRARSALDESIHEMKRDVMREYRDSEQYKADLAELLRPSVEQTFAQVHDYRQLISQIVQHVNVFLETRFPRLSLDDQLEKANPNIRSIYWAARLMEFKLQAALFLAYPDRIVDPRHKRVFRLHGAVHKYLQIYKPILETRNLKLRVIGESHGNLMENPDAIGVIPQAFLDNAIKYAPDGSEIEVNFSEDDEIISLQVRSEGPKIAQAETSRVFELFFRGAEARASGEDGTGFGLGLAQLVADRVGARLSVSQEHEPAASGGHPTSFRAIFSKPIEGEGPPSIVNARARQRGGRPVKS